MKRLPKRSKSKAVGNVAADLASAAFSRFSNVVPVPESRDLGIDFYCELMDSLGFPTGQIFNIQCKGTEEVERKGSMLSVSVKVSTANYWLIRPEPTFLVVVDVISKILYWAYPRKQLTENASWVRQKTVSIVVDTSNRFGLDVTGMPRGMKMLLDSHLPAWVETVIERLDNIRIPAALGDSEHPWGLVHELMDIADTIDAVDRLQQRAAALISRLQGETLQVVPSLRQKSEDLLYRLDYTPGSAKLWKDDSDIFTFEFGAGSSKDIWARVDSALRAFKLTPSRENHSELLSALGELIQLNRDIYWTIETVRDSLL